VRIIVPFEFISTTDLYFLERRGVSRARKIKNISLAAAGDADEIWALYHQLFTIQTVPTEPLPAIIESESQSGHDAWHASDDLGVEYFCNLDDATLNHLLQFPQGRPALFSEYRSKSGICAWDDAKSNDFTSTNADMQRLSLMWHQRVGIASVANKIWFSKSTTAGVPGILIADDVGVGKTALTMGTLAFIMDAYWVQEFLAGRAKPGSAQHLKSLDPSNIQTAPLLSEYHVSTHVGAIR
jgi:hypothetical protein